MIKKKYTYNLFNLFLFSHLVIWTSIPTLTNTNLPLDTIEALAWGSNLDWGFSKHPPLSAFLAETFYQIFGKQDWAYYLLSQLCVLVSFYFVWKLAEELFENNLLSLISVLLLEGIYFFNFTTPEFNVNICELPFWSLSVYYFWKSFKNDKLKDWCLLGLFSALGFLSKYLFIYLLLSISFFLIYRSLKKKNFIKNYLLPVLIFIAILSPHFYWLLKNNFITIFYGLNRTGLETSNNIDHLINPVIFIIKQFFILTPFLFMLFILIKKIKIKFSYKDENFLFLVAINIIPILLIFLTSFFTGATIRTMWMTPFYLFLGIFLVYIFKREINLTNFRKFLIIFTFLFILSPTVYAYISTTKKNKRTDYPGKEIAYLVQNKWNKNFVNEISIVVGDEWAGGNLSYHLKSRPTWYQSLDTNKITGGVIYVGNPKILKKVCPGVFGTLKPIGICMIGVK